MAAPSRLRPLAVALAGMVLAGALLVPLAEAQFSFGQGGIGPYLTHYVVYGRVVDVNGRPVLGKPFTLTIDDSLGGVPSKGTVEGFTAERGSIQGHFKIGEVTPNGKLTLAVENETFVLPLDPELRRTDFAVSLQRDDYADGSWRPDPRSWEGIYSLRVRVVNLTGAYPSPSGGNLYGSPYGDVLVHATLVDQDNVGSDAIPVKATTPNGDYNFTWTLPVNLTSGVVVVTVNGVTQNHTLDTHTRYTYATFKFGESRLPKYVQQETPAPAWAAPAALVVAALAAVALGGSHWGARSRR